MGQNKLDHRSVEALCYCCCKANMTSYIASIHRFAAQQKVFLHSKTVYATCVIKHDGHVLHGLFSKLTCLYKPAEVTDNSKKH